MQKTLLEYGLPRYVYHITTTAKASAILKAGITPGMPSSETGWDGDSEYWPDETPIEAIAREILEHFLNHSQYWFAWPSLELAKAWLRNQNRYIDYVILKIDIGQGPVKVASNTLAELIFSNCHHLASEGFDIDQCWDDCDPDIIEITEDIQRLSSEYKNGTKIWNGETDLDGHRPELLIGQLVEPDRINICGGL